MVLGALVALQPMFGFPHSWEAAFQILAGLLIILISIWAIIDKRLTLKVKAERRQAMKRREAEMIAEKQADTETQPTVQEEPR